MIPEDRQVLGSRPRYDVGREPSACRHTVRKVLQSRRAITSARLRTCPASARRVRRAAPRPEPPCALPFGRESAKSRTSPRAHAEPGCWSPRTQHRASTSAQRTTCIENCSKCGRLVAPFCSVSNDLDELFNWPTGSSCSIEAKCFMNPRLAKFPSMSSL